MFLGVNTLECESSTERKFPGQFAPGKESSKERESQGAKKPGSESSRERIGQGPIGRFAPGSELARERKGCESCDKIVPSRLQTTAYRYMSYTTNRLLLSYEGWSTVSMLTLTALFSDDAGRCGLCGRFVVYPSTVLGYDRALGQIVHLREPRDDIITITRPCLRMRHRPSA